jgi:hypothetical protein
VLKKKYVVKIMQSRDNKSTALVFKTVGARGLSKREAEKVEDGLNISLNHEKFWTCVVEKK